MAEVIPTKKDMNYEVKLRKHKRRRHILITTTLLVILVSAIYFMQLTTYKRYNTYEVLTTTPRTDSSSVQYEKFGKNLLKYSRDGASVISSKGEVIWNSTYDMKEPKADIRGNYVAIGDIGNKDLYVYDENGTAGHVNTLLPILQVKVAKQGVVAVLLQDKDSNMINLYNPFEFKVSEPSLFDFRTTVKDGYPIDIDISEDGLKLIASYVTVNNGVIQNTINFRNFSEVGDNAIDFFTGVYVYKQMIVPKVEFVTNDIAVAFAEKKFTIYSVKEKPSVVFEQPFDTEIKSIFWDDKHVGFVLDNLEGPESHMVQVYNLKGKKVLEKTIDYEYKKVSIYGNDILFYNDLESYILRLNGIEKFHATFDKNISYIFPINNINKYILIEDTNIEEIKLMEDKER